MKPKYSRIFKRALPSLIILPAMIQITSAAVIPTDPDGSLTIAANTIAASTINATGGVNPLVTIGTGAVLTGNSAAENAIIVNADNYTIVNSGKLSSSGAEGIFTNFNNLTVFNAFSPTSGGSSITGGTDGIVALNDFTLVNESFGMINGMGLNGLGVFSGNTTTVFNDPSATITGTLGGILAGDDAEITNAGSIFGNDGIGIDLGNNGFVTNSGVIIGDTGISAASGPFTLINSGEIRSTGALNDAVVGSVGDDTITLNQGSLVMGNIFGDTGVDTLTFGAGIMTPGGISNAVRGDVDGFDKIIKTGGGVAFIGTPADVGAGLNVFADTINITSGGLYINANIARDTVLVPRATINTSGAALGGTGTWMTDINVLAGGFSAGAIPINLDTIPENSVGSVQVLGNVVHSPGSFIRVDIVPDTVINDGINSDIIEQIGGTFTYNVTGANLRLSPTSVDTVITPGKYTIIDSDSPIVGFGQLGTIGIQFNPNITSTGLFVPSGSGGDFQNSVLAGFTTPTLGDNGSNLELDIAYKFSTLPGLTSGQQAFGAALDAQAGQVGTTVAVQDLIAALSLSSADVVQNTFAQIGSSDTFAISSSVINSNYRLNRMIQDRLTASRSGGSSVRVQMGSSAKMVDREPMMTSSGTGSFWGSISGDHQDFDGSNNASDFDGDVGAVTAGYDYRFNPDFMIGGLVDASSADLDSTDIDSVRFAVYGTYGRALGFYSDFLVGYGRHDFDQSTNILGNNFRSDTDADSFQALITAGYSMGTETVKHGPFVGLEYQNLDVDGFNRTGGGVNFNVGDYAIDSLRGLIGYRLNIRSGAFTPYASVAYAHEFQGDADNVNSNFAGIPLSSRGSDLESAILVTAGTGFDITNDLVLDIGYRGEISVEDDGLTSHGASLGLSYSF